MTEKELKKLNRYQLLELLLLQTERAEKLQRELDETKAQISQQELQFLSLGSIAEASVQITGVFEAAQRAADLYVEAAQRRADEILKEAKKRARRILWETESEVQFFAHLSEEPPETKEEE